MRKDGKIVSRVGIGRKVVCYSKLVSGSFKQGSDGAQKVLRIVAEGILKLIMATPKFSAVAFELVFLVCLSCSQTLFIYSSLRYVAVISVFHFSISTFLKGFLVPF